MNRPIRTRARRSSVGLAVVAVAVLLAACGSASTPAAGSPGGSTGASPSATPAVAASSAPSSQASPAPSASPAPVASAAASPGASGSTTGAKGLPSGTPCDWLDKATIDATLGLSVGKAIPNVGDKKGEICTWLSTAPKGGVTLAILPAADLGGFLASYKQLPGGQLVPGLGVKAVALFITGQAAPLPASHAQVFVDFGGWGLSVDVSGPAATVGEAAALAAYVTN